MEKNYDLSHSRAVNVVTSADKRRLNLYRKLGKTDYDEPSLYHLVLNMSRVEMQTALKLVCDLINSSD